MNKKIERPLSVKIMAILLSFPFLILFPVSIFGISSMKKWFLNLAMIVSVIDILLVIFYAVTEFYTLEIKIVGIFIVGLLPIATTYVFWKHRKLFT